MRPVLFETALFAPDYPRATAPSRELAALRRAISERRLIHFRYAREDGTESERDARPLGLYFWGSKWTLAAWCGLREDYRSFRPDRMRELVLLDTTYDPSDGIDLGSYLARRNEEDRRNGWFDGPRQDA
ncbi:MAG: WYL domain-containing protein [Myxococcota bacterium]|nr:WYL domain-containing protein [Myxococcota bacterium]